MPIVPLHKLGTLGLVRDTPFHELPLYAWSDGRNVRFDDGAVESFLGETSLRALTATPLHLSYVNQTGVKAFVHLTRTKAFAVTSSAETDISRVVGGAYAAHEETAPWCSTFLTSIPVYNNFADIPQVWTPVSIAQPLVNLPNWPSTLRAKSLRAFKNFLVAVGVSKSGTVYPHMVKWSAVADPGAVPPSWDETDNTREAGENDLADTPGVLIDSLPLGDVNVLYKEDCVWGMSFIGGVFVFQFRKLFEDFGLFALNCVVGFRHKHCVLTQNDLIVHDGQRFESVLNEVWRKELFSRIDVLQKHKVFLFHHIVRKEIWVCYPTLGSTWCSDALVWNYDKNTIGHRDLQDISSMALGDVGANESFDTDTANWDDDSIAWDGLGTGLNLQTPHGIRADASPQLRKFETGNTNNGTAVQCSVERQGWAIDGGRTPEGEPRCDLTTIKFINALYPKFECAFPEKLRFYVGSQMFQEGPVTWHGPFTVNSMSGFKIDCSFSARLLAFKVDSLDDVYWRLWGVDVELAQVSKF